MDGPSSSSTIKQTKNLRHRPAGQPNGFDFGRSRALRG